MPNKNKEEGKKGFGQLKRLLLYMGRYKFRLIIMISVAILGESFMIVGPKILGGATTVLFNGIAAKLNGSGGIDFSKLTRILFTVLLLYLLGTLFAFIQGFIMISISNDMSYSLRAQISKKLNLLPMKYYESRPYGEVLSRITNDVDTMQQGINQSINQFVTSFTSIIGAIIMMLSISPIMTLAALLILPISMLIIGFIMKHSQRFFTDRQANLGEVNGKVEESYAGQNVIKAFCKEKRTVEEFEAANNKLYESGWKSQFFSGIMMPVVMLIGNIGYAVVAFLGGFLVIKRSIEVGDIQAFLQYIRNFTQPVQQVAQALSLLQSSTAASERIFELLDEEEEEQGADRRMKALELDGNVVFDKVSFGYDADKVIIHNFSADIKNGQKIAIVGPTGAGKTTIVKLLMRFYDVNGGSIKIDGVDLREFNRQDLRSLLGMVLQDTWLFNGTIMENIRYGCLDATDDEVMAAARAAHLHKFIMQQPKGYDTVLDEETGNISQGQKQLLTIARAILADNKILILDEATSSVDTMTEVRIQKAMDNLMKGRTSFVIAHRLSTIMNADTILVMKDGDIIEQGSHDVLMDRGGFYSQLYNSQFESVGS